MQRRALRRMKTYHSALMSRTPQMLPYDTGFTPGPIYHPKTTLLSGRTHGLLSESLGVTKPLASIHVRQPGRPSPDFYKGLERFEVCCEITSPRLGVRWPFRGTMSPVRLRPAPQPRSPPFPLPLPLFPVCFRVASRARFADVCTPRQAANEDHRSRLLFDESSRRQHLPIRVDISMTMTSADRPP